jgi:ParB-like chromosome segregation protein Spo0J
MMANPTAMKVALVNVDDLKPDPKNPRLHDERNVKAVARSLEEFGQRKPIVVRQGMVIAGNGTLEAARLLGWGKVLAAEVPEDWTERQARAFAIADNRTAELANWNGNVLLGQLEELNVDDLLGSTGFNLDDLADLQAVFGPTKSLDDLGREFEGGDEGDGLWPTITFRAPQAIKTAWQSFVAEQENEAAALAKLLGIAWKSKK